MVSTALSAQEKLYAADPKVVDGCESEVLRQSLGGEDGAEGGQKVLHSLGGKDHGKVVDGCESEVLRQTFRVAICNSKGLDLSYENALSGLVSAAVRRPWRGPYPRWRHSPSSPSPRSGSIRLRIPHWKTG